MIIIVNGAALFFTDLLQDDVLGVLGRDPAEGLAVDIHADHVADLSVLVDLSGVVQRNLNQVIHHIIVKLNDSLLRVAGILKTVLVYLDCDILQSAEMTLAGCDQRILDCFEKCIAADDFLFYKCLDGSF